MAKTWRASSEPIEPPAPVMTTVRSADDLLDAGGVLGHHRPPEQVLDADPADAIGVELPSSSSVTDGTVRTSRLEGQRGLDDAADGVPGALGIVMRSVWAPGRGDGPLQRLEAPEDAEAGDDAAGEARVVVEEADRPHAGARVPPAERAMSTPAWPAP